MKSIFAAILFTVSTTAMAGNIIANGTRFIYPSNEKEISVQLTNTSIRPSLVQSWLDLGDPNSSPDDISVPFSITPPVAKVDVNSGQTLRIRNIGKAGLATDRETLLFLNILDIPASASGDKDKNTLSVAIRSRFKFIYRPVGLGNANAAPQQLSLTVNGNKLTITNPTPFYISVGSINKLNKEKLNLDAITVAPKSSQTISLSKSVSRNEKVEIITINDYGTNITFSSNIK